MKKNITEDFNKIKFISPTYGSINVKEILNIITEKIKKNPNVEWIIAIGTDSQNKGPITTFCSTIILLEKGKGGIYFYSRDTQKRIEEVQYRMLTEAEKSIELSRVVLAHLEDLFMNDIFDFHDYDLSIEIHCDLGKNGKSRDSISAAIGWITAEFDGKIIAKTKPNSPAASCVADKHTK